MIAVDVDEAARVARPQVTIPWFVLAPVGALAVAAAGWLLMAGPAALGWLTSPESQLADALGLASRVVLLANGAVTTIGGQAVSIAPLGLTLALILLGVPVAGLAARAAIDETDDLRGLVLRVGGTYAGTYIVFITLIAFFVPETSVIRAFLGSVLIGGISGFWGVTRAVGYDPCERWPVRAQSFPRGIGVAALICVGTGAALLSVVLILGRERVAAIADGLGGDGTAGILLIVIQLAWLPNLVIWAMAWALGAGVTLGEGTLLDMNGTSLGFLPSIPVLGAVPDPGPVPELAWLWLLGGVLAGVLATLVAPQLLGRLVTRVSEGTGTVGYVDGVVAVIVAVTIAGAAINRFAQMYARTLGESVFADLRERMMTRVVHLPLSAVESAGTGDLVGRTTNDVSRIEFPVGVGVPQIMVCRVTIVFTIVAAAVSDPVLAAGLLVVVPPVWAMMSWYLPISVPAYRAESAAHARLNGAVTETVENAETVDALGIGRRREAVIADRVAQAWGLERYTAGLRLRLFLVLDVAWRSPVVVILIWGGFLAARGHATLGAITTVSLYAMELRKPIAQLMFWIDLVQVSQASLTRILGVEEVRDDRTPTGAVPDGTRMALRGVRFSYRQGVEVLHGIDLDLVPGERLAVVGPSGSGKSTLGRMLAGINPPTSGSVTVGGVPLTDLSEAELRQHVALVTQEHHVFVGTIADNVRLGRPDADDGTIRRAIEAIGANSWVDALGEGMRTMVGSGHLTLSPAQAQEVALARLVLLDPHTLILDEATSLLDPRSARALERTLSTALAGRTVVEVVHRLYTAQDADRVAVVMDGRIVELGTHEQLVALGGEYASLWEAWSQE